MSLITEAQLAVMLPTNKEVGEWCAALNEMLPKYGITTDKRISGFISQCAHESSDFRVLQENLNYKEATLLKVFPRYFGPGKENAAEYAGKPEKIANYVYMDKNRSKGGALGNVKDGDGWLFSGKGLKQVTGRANTTAFGKTVGMTAEEAAAYLLTKKGALESALWFWGSRNLNDVADTGDVVKLTKIINLGPCLHWAVLPLPKLKVPLLRRLLGLYARVPRVRRSRRCRRLSGLALMATLVRAPRRHLKSGRQRMA